MCIARRLFQFQKMYMQRLSQVQTCIVKRLSQVQITCAAKRLSQVQTCVAKRPCQVQTCTPKKLFQVQTFIAKGLSKVHTSIAPKYKPVSQRDCPKYKPVLQKDYQVQTCITNRIFPSTIIYCRPSGPSTEAVPIARRLPQVYTEHTLQFNIQFSTIKNSKIVWKGSLVLVHNNMRRYN